MTQFRVHAQSTGFSPALDETPNFEAIFRVPSAHSLVLVRSKSQGSPAAAIFWEHLEHDGSGRIIARYHSFEQIDETGGRRSGWHKFANDGHLLAEGDTLS